MARQAAEQELGSAKAGEYIDEEDEETIRRLKEWITAWRIDPEHPSRALPPGVVKGKATGVTKFGPAQLRGTFGSSRRPDQSSCLETMRTRW